MVVNQPYRSESFPQAFKEKVSWRVKLTQHVLMGRSESTSSAAAGGAGYRRRRAGQASPQ